MMEQTVVVDKGRSANVKLQPKGTKMGSEWKAILRTVSMGAIRPAAPCVGTRQNLRYEARRAQYAKVAHESVEPRRNRRNIARNKVRLLGPVDALLNTLNDTPRPNTSQD